MEAASRGGIGAGSDPGEPPPSDGELIRLICDGSAEAANDLLLHRHRDFLAYLARKYDEELISDLYAHLFSGGTWERLKKWDGRGAKFTTWLAVVASRLYLDRIRARGREAGNLRKFARTSGRHAEDDRAEQSRPEAGLVAGEARSARVSSVLRALATLPPRDRLILSHLDLRDPPYPVESVAEMIGLRVEAVRTARSRAKERLRKALEADGVDSDD